MIIHTFNTPKSNTAWLFRLNMGSGVDGTDLLSCCGIDSTGQVKTMTAAFHGPVAARAFIKELEIALQKYEAIKIEQPPPIDPELRRIEIVA